MSALDIYPERNEVTYYKQRIGNDSVYGDGSDGNVTIANGVTTQITRDMYYNNLTIDSGGRLLTYGFKVFVKGTLTVNGAIGSYGSNVSSPGAATPGTIEQGRTTGNITNSMGASSPGSTATALSRAQLYELESVIAGTVRTISGSSAIFGGAYGSDGTDGTTYTAPTDWPNRLGAAGNPGAAGTGAGAAPTDWPNRLGTAGTAGNQNAYPGNSVAFFTHAHTRPAHHGGGDHHYVSVPHTFTNHVAEAVDYDDWYQVRVYGGDVAPPTEYHNPGHHDAAGGSPASHHYHINGNNHNHHTANPNHAYMYQYHGNSGHAHNPHHFHYDVNGNAGSNSHHYHHAVHKGNPAPGTQHTYWHNAHRVNRYHRGLIGGPTIHSGHYSFNYPGGHSAAGAAGNAGNKGNAGNNGVAGPGGTAGNAGNAANNGAGGTKGLGGPGGPLVLLVAKKIIGSGTIDSYSYRGTAGGAATLATAGNAGTGAGTAPTDWPNRLGAAGNSGTAGTGATAATASNNGQYPPNANTVAAGGRAPLGNSGNNGVAGPGGTAGNAGTAGNPGNNGVGGPINPTAPTAGTGGKAGGNGGIIVVTDSIAGTVTLQNSTWTPTVGDATFNAGTGMQVVVLNQ